MIWTRVPPPFLRTPLSRLPRSPLKCSSENGTHHDVNTISPAQSIRTLTSRLASTAPVLLYMEVSGRLPTRLAVKALVSHHVGMLDYWAQVRDVTFTSGDISSAQTGLIFSACEVLYRAWVTHPVQLWCPRWWWRNLKWHGHFLPRLPSSSLENKFRWIPRAAFSTFW